MTKFFLNVFTKRLLKKPLQSKNVIALNLYIAINQLVYERRLMMNVFSMTRCVKFFLFCKTCYILSNNVQIIFWGAVLIQAPNISKHISRNGGATIKVSRKTAYDKVFFILGQKGHFFPKHGGTLKNVTALNLYIGTTVLVYERRLMVKVWSMTKILC